jgi:hypothetical protein
MMARKHLNANAHENRVATPLVEKIRWRFLYYGGASLGFGLNGRSTIPDWGIVQTLTPKSDATFVLRNPRGPISTFSTDDSASFAQSGITF